MSTQTSFTEYNLPQTGYLTFDANSLKTLIIEKLNNSNVFTDQNYEGSNINAFIDVVAYMYHVLMFYLNTTATESTFTTATIYENISKIISNIGYKPQGKQTSLVTVSISASESIQPGLYTVPKFAFVSQNGIPFVTIEDISFEKTTFSSESIATDNNILYQGSITEYPQYAATGEPFETITIVSKENTDNNEDNQTFIADNTFTVYVKDKLTGKWSEWIETASLYLEDSNSFRYEKRINEYGNYEFKFGNDLNGKKLKDGDIVQLFYILSDGEKGTIGSGTLNNSKFTVFTTPVLDEIRRDTYLSSNFFINNNTAQFITISNTNNSTPIVKEETVEDIRENAPKIFSLQNRLVTQEDYEFFITKKFNNIVKSVKTLSNNEYIDRYIQYFYRIGLSKPNQDARVLLEQVNYSTSTSFNNVYIFTVPAQTTILNNTIPNYLNPTQKQLLINECSLIKDITHNVIPCDPIYYAFGFGLAISNEQLTKNVINSTKLIIKKNKNTTINNSTLKQTVASIIKEEFEKIKLGSLVDITNIINRILNISGVEKILTRRIDTNFEIPLMSCAVWNPVYDQADIRITSQNIQLEDFQYAYFYDVSNISNNIIIEAL